MNMFGKKAIINEMRVCWDASVILKECVADAFAKEISDNGFD